MHGVFEACKLSLYEAQQPLALLTAVRALAEGVNAEFIFMLKSLIHSHFCIDLLDADREGHLLIGDGFCLHLAHIVDWEYIKRICLRSTRFNNTHSHGFPAAPSKVGCSK